MDSKTRFNNKKVLNEIGTLKRKYSYGKSIVIYCVDTDKYLSNPNDVALTNKIKEFCFNGHFEFVFFCEDIEQVFLGKSVPSNTKKKEAVNFVRNSSIQYISQNQLLSRMMVKDIATYFVLSIN